MFDYSITNAIKPRSVCFLIRSIPTLASVALTSLFSFFFLLSSSCDNPRLSTPFSWQKERSWHISLATIYRLHTCRTWKSRWFRPNNSDPVFCREQRVTRERIPATLIAKTTTPAYVSGMCKRGRGGIGSENPKFGVGEKVRRSSLHTLRAFFFFPAECHLPRYRIAAVRSRCVAPFDSSLF